MSKNEKEYDIELNDICEYLDFEDCCHPDFTKQTTKELCLICQYRKVPIKGKAIALLIELMEVASNAGWELEGRVGFDDEEESQTEEQKIVIDLSEKLKEVEQFLNSVGIDINKERIVKNGEKFVRTKK